MSSSAPRGDLFIVSAPSGAGKTTVVEEVIRRTPRLVRSRSYTSRRARPGEQDGVAYNFVSRDRFEAMRAGDQFLEWAEFSGNLYGTSKLDTERVLAGGDDLVLVIEVQGAAQVRSHGWPNVSVFLLPPSFEALEQRLRDRSLDSEAQIQRRLETACVEVASVPDYDFVVINDDLDACVSQVQAIVLDARAARQREAVSAAPDVRQLAEAARRQAMAATVGPILAGFARHRS